MTLLRHCTECFLTWSIMSHFVFNVIAALGAFVLNVIAALGGL